MDTQDLFNGAASFKGNVSGWDISKVTKMAGMFQDAISFNVDLSGWNTEKAEVMSDLFMGATSFNQNLCDWSINTNYFGAIFDQTSCPNQADPFRYDSGGGKFVVYNFCYDCE